MTLLHKKTERTSRNYDPLKDVLLRLPFLSGLWYTMYNLKK